jgi:hypothetical protein
MILHEWHRQERAEKALTSRSVILNEVKNLPEFLVR